jgi:hypothetical protein
MVKWKLTEKAIKEQIAKAKEQTLQADVIEPQAKAAYYDQSANRIVVELSNGTDFRFSPLSVEELVGASPDEIAQVEISPSGRTLRWKKLDADLSLPALMMGIFGTKMWMAHLGRTGGQATSQAKVAAARLNGMKGGRPKKVVHVTRAACTSPSRTLKAKSVSTSALSNKSARILKASALTQTAKRHSTTLKDIKRSVGKRTDIRKKK